MHYLYWFQLVSMMLCNLPFISICVLFSNPHIFLVLLLRETETEDALRQSFESEVSNNERPPIQPAASKGSSGATATGLAVASRALHTAPGQHQRSSQPTLKQGIEYGGGHWSVPCCCTLTTRKRRRSSGPFYASPPATTFAMSLHSHRRTCRAGDHPCFPHLVRSGPAKSWDMEFADMIRFLGLHLSRSRDRKSLGFFNHRLHVKI
jgi:hypothetical protein